MELRSNRSRSRTPLLSQELIDQEVAASGNHVEKVVVRTTRRTTVIKTNESASSSTDELNTLRDTSSSHQTKSSSRRSPAATTEAQKSERALRSRLIKTSDYSSEDGENEVSSTKTISQNERNQLLENARVLANGSDMPALELYRKSGRYWDVYPKTDWTYSYHSKDRVEIAPGVVAMPNMSRKTIHALDESNRSQSFESNRSYYSDNVSHKNTNTEHTYSSRYSEGLGEGLKRSTYTDKSEDYYIKRRSYSRWSSFKQTVTSVFTSIFTSIFSVFYFTYRTQTAMFSYIHWVASRVMLWDTYLLWKARPGDKAKKLAFLCLLPLLLFGGVHMLLASGATLALSCHPYCDKMASAYFHSLLESVYNVFSFNNTTK